MRLLRKVESTRERNQRNGLSNICWIREVALSCPQGVLEVQLRPQTLYPLAGSLKNQSNKSVFHLLELFLRETIYARPIWPHTIPRRGSISQPNIHLLLWVRYLTYHNLWMNKTSQRTGHYRDKFQRVIEHRCVHAIFTHPHRSRINSIVLLFPFPCEKNLAWKSSSFLETELWTTKVRQPSSEIPTRKIRSRSQHSRLEALSTYFQGHGHVQTIGSCWCC